MLELGCWFLCGMESKPYELGIRYLMNNVHASDLAGLCIFFFFKQKTADELRISDWSSDVCSSDLRGSPVVLEAAGDPRRRGEQVQNVVAEVAQQHRGEIGRASCRERVCQYV